MHRLLRCLALPGLIACSDPAPAPEPAPPPVALDVDDPSACASCHAAVVAEWRTSMHARAHHTEDPVYAAMRTLRMGREGDGLATRCAQCHSPRDPEHPDSAIARTGVACASCHMLAGLDATGGRRGAAALRGGEAMRGPHDVADGVPAPHQVGEAAPWITDGRTLCLACHGEMRNAQGVPTCTTGSEHEGAERSCTNCHMPLVDGASGAVSSRAQHRSHAFLGPHALWTAPESPFVASAVRVSAQLDGTSLRATLENRAQHGVPSGFPGRMLLVRATAYDAAGEIVFRNFTDDPMTQDRDAVLHRAYVDGDGQPALPPYAARVARDSRLAPDETRTLEWTVPSTATRADVELLYRLLPPPAARQLGLEDAVEAEPRRVLVASTSEAVP